jgi:hypothetical protein
MAYISETYDGGRIAATDLQRIEDNFEYLRTHFKAAAAPADPGGGLEGVIWWDSSGGANPSTSGVLRIRDDAGWRAVFTGSAAFKIWAYLDTAENGWARDSNMKDQVLALKSDAGDYVTGATYNKGSWIISGLTDSGHTHTHDHLHQIYNWTNINNIKVYNAAGAEIGVTTTLGAQKGIVGDVSANGSLINHDVYTDEETSNTSSDTATIVSSGAWRIRASVGIMVYPDI